MRTRTSAPAKKSEEETTETPLHALTTAERPSKTFILPSSASNDARFVSLPNPRTEALNRYFFCPRLGVYEFTVVASTPQSPRSTLVTSKADTTADSKGDVVPTRGVVSKMAELLIATPIDAIFFLVPLFSALSGSQKGLFQSLDDIIDSNDELPRHLRYVLYNDTFRDTLFGRAEAICDSVEAGDEKMYRLNETKLLKELIEKAERMVAQGLPASLEERFIKQALKTPMMAIKTEAPTNGASTKDEIEGDSQEKQDTPSTTTPSATTPSGVSTPATELPPEEPGTPENVVKLLRISTALCFMKESYLSPSTCKTLDDLLAAPENPLDFKPLHEHLKHVSNLRAEALASRTLSDFSRKRGADDEEFETRAEKKRRKEEEEKKKKIGESRGVRDLKKVDTKGMKKMSDFFGKPAAKKS